MPIAKGKPKARARVGVKAKRAAIKKAFGRDIPIDSQSIDFFFARRNLAKTRLGKWRDLKYVDELFDLEMVIWKTLDRIRARDGMKIFNEAADYLARAIRLTSKLRRGSGTISGQPDRDARVSRRRQSARPCRSQPSAPR